ncbi:uncharacterized protein LOC124889315 isoform X3 [Capsicum annuum]|uniref:uncharacterized protein LOC124889315 isoform X3 n=1 Tax=Capsicum annuum TaxID=4072 RepID=UPI001FB088BD|nr:uncharacterized protein LOC124889315 isoform X3 [Capsicum annuum]
MKIRGRLVFYVIHQMEKHGTILIECVQILLMNRGMFEWVCVLMNLQHFLSQLHQILVGQSLSHRLIPIAFSSLSERIWKSITEISLFFKELCSNTLKRDDLLLMKQNIRILCMRHYLEVLFNIDGCTHGKGFSSMPPPSFSSMPSQDHGMSSSNPFNNMPSPDSSSVPPSLIRTHGTNSSYLAAMDRRPPSDTTLSKAIQPVSPQLSRSNIGASNSEMCNSEAFPNPSSTPSSVHGPDLPPPGELDQLRRVLSFQTGCKCNFSRNPETL